MKKSSLILGLLTTIAFTPAFAGGDSGSGSEEPKSSHASRKAPPPASASDALEEGGGGAVTSAAPDLSTMSTEELEAYVAAQEAARVAETEDAKRAALLQRLAALGGPAEELPDLSTSTSRDGYAADDEEAEPTVEATPLRAPGDMSIEELREQAAQRAAERAAAEAAREAAEAAATERARLLAQIAADEAAAAEANAAAANPVAAPPPQTKAERRAARGKTGEAISNLVSDIKHAWKGKKKKKKKHGQ